MRNFFTFFIMFSFCSIGIAQKRNYKAEIGLDFAPAFANLVHGGNNYRETQFMFRTNLQHGYLRLQFQRYSDNLYGYNSDLPIIEYKVPALKIIGVVNQYTLTARKAGLIGYTQKKSINKHVEFYYGADIGIGYNKTHISADYIYSDDSKYYNRIVGEHRDQFFTAMFYPTIGLKFYLSKKIALSVESHFAGEYNFGEWDLYTNIQETISVPTPFNGWAYYSSWYDRIKISNVYLTYSFGKIRKK